MGKVTIVLPMQASTLIDLGLLAITKRIHTKISPVPYGGFPGGKFGHGANYENKVFQMHCFCWCEKKDCLWCSGCKCSQSKTLRMVDGRICTPRAQDQFSKKLLQRFTNRYLLKHLKEWNAAIAERNRRSITIYPSLHHTCGQPIFFDKPESLTWEPDARAAHFWHKETGLRIWWYKWIGREMKFYGFVAQHWPYILRECLRSIK